MGSSNKIVGIIIHSIVLESKRIYFGTFFYEVQEKRSRTVSTETTEAGAFTFEPRKGIGSLIRNKTALGNGTCERGNSRVEVKCVKGCDSSLVT